MRFVTYNNSSKWQLHQGSQKIVLVGHSFGGLVIKSLMVQVHKVVKEGALEKKKRARCKAFQKNVKGERYHVLCCATHRDRQGFQDVFDRLQQHSRLAELKTA